MATCPPSLRLEKDSVLWEILIQFVFRLFLGLAVAMSATSPRQVNSQFFRVHLWVLLGLGTFGSLVAYSHQSLFDQPTTVLGLALTATLMSYLGSVIWLYDKPRAGMAVLAMIAIVTVALLLHAHPSKQPQNFAHWCWLALDITSGSLLLGSTFAAMLLGHWYLNSPGMKLAPLNRLLFIMVVALVGRGVLAGIGGVIHYGDGEFASGFAWAALSLRWLAGIVGLGGLTWMTWQTLKIPNTQSATGILYVALVFVFLGELASATLAFESPVPL